MSKNLAHAPAGQSNNSEESQQNSPLLVPRATGPRTQLGKERSKHNALKHGIFSKVVVLKDESQAEFDALLTGLRNDLQPEGTLEEILVEKLAALLWRNRRLWIAEAAEIRTGAEFVDWDKKHSQQAEMAELPIFGGLIKRISDSEALQKCLDLLDELRESIERDGFNLELDKKILEKLYGYDEHDWRETLFSLYVIWVGTSRVTEERRQREGYASPEQCKDNFLKALADEKKRLDVYRKEQAKVNSSKLELEALRHNVPEAPRLDRLLRYETTLERAIDRTLNQLERHQRFRLGQPVPPSVNINI